MQKSIARYSRIKTKNMSK